MDYKEKYEQALERARKLQENSNGMILKKWLWGVFPELKESEGNIMRKMCMRYLDREYQHCPSADDRKNIEKWIAWLEKQGQQKPTINIEENIPHKVSEETTLYQQLKKTKKMEKSSLIGKQIIARVNNAGVFFGTLESVNADFTKMTEVRRIYYWEGALSVTHIAVDGITGGKVTVAAASVEFLTSNIIELVECAEKAIKNLQSIKPWKS